MDIRRIEGTELGAELRRGTDAAAPGGFKDLLRRSIAEVNRLQSEADQAITALATGEKVSLHDTMIALEKADISFRLMMQVRRKIVTAFEEIMRMQV